MGGLLYTRLADVSSYIVECLGVCGFLVLEEVACFCGEFEMGAWVCHGMYRGLFWSVAGRGYDGVLFQCWTRAGGAAEVHSSWSVYLRGTSFEARSIHLISPMDLGITCPWKAC